MSFDKMFKCSQTNKQDCSIFCCLKIRSAYLWKRPETCYQKLNQARRRMR